MVLSLRYGDLSGAVSETNRLANELGQYCDDLSRKVQRKMYSVEGGMSSSLNSADYYVNQKIRQLRAREGNARTLSTRIQTLLDTAKRVDMDVERTIQASQKALFQKNPELKAPWYKQAFASFMCDMKNVPVIGWLIKGGEQMAGAWDTLIKDLRYWYKCEGGKELVGIVLSVVGAILAVVVAVCAFVFTGGTILAVILGVVGIIGAIIGLVNAVTNVVTSFQAYNEATGGHPGRAKIYAGQDKLSDVLRQTNFHNKDFNRASNAAAIGIEITDIICSVVTMVSGAVKTIKTLKDINISRTFQAICQPRNSFGQFTQGKPTLWQGVKTIALKFNIKDFVLGDLNIKDLSRISKIPKVDAFSAIDDLTSAVQGIVNNLDKVNEGEQTFGEFIAKRVVGGFDTVFLKEQVLRTSVKDGARVRKFEDTKFTTIINAIRIPIDRLGLGKVLTDVEHSGTLSNVLNMKDGVLQSVSDIVKQLKSWTPPMVDLGDLSFGLKTVTGDNALSKVDVSYDLSIPAFTAPKLNFNLKFSYLHPYFNVGAA